jgi:hypothetical protein
MAALFICSLLYLSSLVATLIGQCSCSHGFFLVDLLIKEVLIGSNHLVFVDSVLLGNVLLPFLKDEALVCTGILNQEILT